MSISEDRFRNLNISPTQPGFFDSPEFLIAEQNDPSLLHDYARYVYGRTPVISELNRAEAIIRDVAKFLHERLVSDGRQGACADMAQVLSRFLEREGVWNVPMGGALRVETPIGSTSFGPIAVGPNPPPVAHAWVYAPPFEVIDLTVKQQPYSPLAVKSYLPNVILSIKPLPGRIRATDFFDLPALEVFIARNGRSPTMQDVYILNPDIKNALVDFPVSEIKKGDTILTYIPIRGAFPDGPLEEATNLVLSGKSPFELYQEYISNKEKR